MLFQGDDGRPGLPGHNGRDGPQVRPRSETACAHTTSTMVASGCMDVGSHKSPFALVSQGLPGLPGPKVRTRILMFYHDTEIKQREAREPSPPPPLWTTQTPRGYRGNPQQCLECFYQHTPPSHSRSPFPWRWLSGSY